MALVKNNSKKIQYVGLKAKVIQLMVGVNEVAEGDLVALLDHPLFKLRVESGEMQIIDQKKDEAGKPLASSMIKAIPDMYDQKLLKEIIENDGREQVILAAEKQLEKIKRSKKSEPKNEHFS